MKFETEYALQEFRNLQSELFDERGKRYTGVQLSFGQAEQMLKLINMMADEISTNALLLQSLKEAREMLITSGVYKEGSIGLAGMDELLKNIES